MGKKAYLRETAELLYLTEYQLRRRVNEHKIPYITSGRKYIFDIELCQEYLKREALKNAEPEVNLKTKQYGVLRKISI